MPDALFSTLGISPTTDQKAIRRAYAALLKRTDQAGDPEGFAALREAYERTRLGRMAAASKTTTRRNPATRR